MAPPAAPPQGPFPTARNVHQASLRYRQSAMGSSQESELIEENLPLVRHIVGRLALSLPSHIDVDDLHSAGLVGLLNAVRQYDPAAGSSFGSYARVRIRGEIFDQLRRMDWVPRSVHEKARKIESVIAELETAKGQPPSEAEVAQALGLTTTAYLRLLDEIRPATFVCLDAVMNSEDDPDRTHHEIVAHPTQADPSEDTERSEMAEMLTDQLDQLPDMQKKVMAMYYFEDLRLREIAAVFNVTESRICQIHAQAILTLRARLRRLVEA